MGLPTIVSKFIDFSRHFLFNLTVFLTIFSKYHLSRFSISNGFSIIFFKTYINVFRNLCLNLTIFLTILSKYIDFFFCFVNSNGFFWQLFRNFTFFDIFLFFTIFLSFSLMLIIFSTILEKYIQVSWIFFVFNNTSRL